VRSNIFLLSTEEVNKYLSDEKSRTENYNNKELYANWWLRTIATSSGARASVYCVFDNGSISPVSPSALRTPSCEIGIRPAVWLDYQCLPNEIKRKYEELWISQGKCGDCGGQFSFFGKKCKICKRKKMQ
jgi:hypothetical protein